MPKEPRRALFVIGNHTPALHLISYNVYERLLHGPDAWVQRMLDIG